MTPCTQCAAPCGHVPYLQQLGASTYPVCDRCHELRIALYAGGAPTPPVRSHRRSVRAYQERHLALGLCIRCPEPLATARLCERHRVAEAATKRRRYAAIRKGIGLLEGVRVDAGRSSGLPLYARAQEINRIIDPHRPADREPGSDDGDEDALGGAPWGQ